MSPGAVGTAAGLGLMLASGAAGLGYQIVWTQQATLWLGHDTAAVLAVVAAFFGGLALGAMALGGRIARSLQPARWYAVCELAIAAWGAALLLLIAPAGALLLRLTGAETTPAWQWTVAFAGTLLLLLPATVAMGATLPAMDAWLARAHPGRGKLVAALYAANTAGAVLGVLAAAFWLVPAHGLRATAGLCVLLNLVCAALAAWRGWTLPGTPTGPQAPPPPRPAALPGRRTAVALLAATGLLGIAQEVLVVRVLSQVAENTVYTFALLLAVYLVGTAGGAAAFQRWGGSAQATGRSTGRLLALLGAACLLGNAALWWAPTLQAAALSALQALLGPGLGPLLGAEAVLALLAFGPPTLVMGALFSQLMVSARNLQLPLGQAIGINTLGAALAPALFGVALLPVLQAKAALLLVAGAYLLLAAWLCWRQLWLVPGLVGLLAAAWLAPPLRHVPLGEGGQLLAWHEGAMAAVSVVQDADGVRRLHINGRQQEGDSRSRLADGRQALLPLLLHPAPRTALFLGLGTGTTAAVAATDPQLQVQVVELLPEVVAAAAQFRADAPGGGQRLQIHTADARRHVRSPGPAYDLIVADNVHPARSGSAALYTVEHFQAVAARLAPGGVFCQWLPLHQLDLATLRSIVRSFTTVYPEAGALLATLSLDTPVLGLVARQGGGRHDMTVLQQRRHRLQASVPLADYGLGDDWAVPGSWVAGPQALARLAAGAPLNTDDHPVVAYGAPQLLGQPSALPGTGPRERLLALLPQLGLAEGELLDAPPGQAGWARRLAAYHAARNAFLLAGRSVQPSADVRQMLAQVQAPLLAVLRTSADFRPADEPLRRMARALAQQDPVAAQQLQATLQQITGR
ncbi:MAG: fused MFS/spermidine synthase [Pseudomonadota bacterium]